MVESFIQLLTDRFLLQLTQLSALSLCCQIIIRIYIVQLFSQQIFPSFHQNLHFPVCLFCLFVCLFYFFSCPSSSTTSTTIVYNSDFGAVSQFLRCFTFTFTFMHFLGDEKMIQGFGLRRKDDKYHAFMLWGYCLTLQQYTMVFWHSWKIQLWYTDTKSFLKKKREIKMDKLLRLLQIWSTNCCLMMHISR